MNSTSTFFVGITVQVVLGILQVAAVVLFVYRWQRHSWRFSNIMKIREPLARAYCSLSAVVRARARLAEDIDDKTKAEHDDTVIHDYLAASQDEIVNFSVEHFKAKFWLSRVKRPAVHGGLGRSASIQTQDWIALSEYGIVVKRLRDRLRPGAATHHSEVPTRRAEPPLPFLLGQISLESHPIRTGGSSRVQDGQ